MNYLVTGAAGFIGSAIAGRLVEEGHNVTTIDNLSTGYKENIPEKVEFIEGDVGDDQIIQKIANRYFDAIFHIAGQSSGEVSFENPIYDLQTNTQSTLVLLELAKKIGCKKFIYASSMSVYGDCPTAECTEETLTHPKSLYAVGKLASENYMSIYSRMYGISCTALRFFNVYGVGQNLLNLKQGMASIYLAMAIQNRKIIVKGSKERFRDFIYIDDVIEVLMRSVKYTTGYRKMNVSTGIPTKVKDVISIITENLDYPVDVFYTNGTPGDQFGIYGNNNMLTRELDYVPTYDINMGLKKMIKWAQTVLNGKDK